MKFDIDYIEKLAKIITENSLTEISLEDAESAITVKKDLPGIVGTPAVSPSVVQSAAESAASASASESAHKGKAIISPMVGTFYGRPSPEAEPFVKIGDVISAGDIVCIVEAMKLMNEIESEFSGKVTEICITDGQAVEYGQPIMYIE